MRFFSILVSILFLLPLFIGSVNGDEEIEQLSFEIDFYEDSDINSGDLTRLQDGYTSGIPFTMIIPPCADGICDVSLILNMTPEIMSNQINLFMGLSKSGGYEEDNNAIHTQIKVKNSELNNVDSWDTLYESNGLYSEQDISLNLLGHNNINGSIIVSFRVWNDQVGQRGAVILSLYEISLNRINEEFECDDGKARALVSIGGWSAQHGQGITLTSTDGTTIFYEGVYGNSSKELNQFSLDGEESDIMDQLKLAIEHLNGHNGSIQVSIINDTINLLQSIEGSSGNTQIISDMPNVWQTGITSTFFSGGCSDEDNDGIIDALDQCPGSNGEEVDINGCSWIQLDDDGDLIPNGMDTQPNNPLIGHVTHGKRFISANETISITSQSRCYYWGMHLYKNISNGKIESYCVYVDDPELELEMSANNGEWIWLTEDIPQIKNGYNGENSGILEIFSSFTGDFNGDGFMDYIDSDCILWMGLDYDGTHYLESYNVSFDRGGEVVNLPCDMYLDFDSTNIVQIADIDNDGYDDIVMAYWGGPIYHSNIPYIEIYYFSEFGISETNKFITKHGGAGDSIIMHLYVYDKENDGDLDIFFQTLYCCGGGQYFHTFIINPDFPDLDHDEISDSDDLCNGTIPSQSVNEQGCALYQLDTDNDGVDDSLDLCSGTTTDLTVNANGCNLTQLDSDGDGLSDALDTCPGTLPQSNINIEGCSEEQIGVSDIDSDQDGVIDSEDNCPETVTGDSVDVNGCAIDDVPDNDTDGDGVIDSEDNCPETVTGDSVDVNGCAIDDVPDNDTDGDGIKDFMDLCQSTPIGSEVDIYGCLINQVDINDASASSNNDSQSYIIIAVSIIFCTLFVTLINRNNTSKVLPVQNGDLSKASSLQNKLNNTINDNLKLRGDRELLQRQLRNKDLTESENAKLRKELNMMQSMTDTNVSEMERMAFELQELRSIIEKSNKEENLKSDNYQDSVHQGDNIGQNIESQTINDADAIARVALESYRQAMKDMREKF
ncbi:thrombospondin type 3 repeat-containing protein [Euryarchaeota archaeon]|nr:thrombospondin type 3 repeat-containing protein [Euryarchaeota archaeon]